MDGYIRNKSRVWKHALKRQMAPGAKIDLDVLYTEYGEKHGIEEGQPFVDWLRTVKLKDNIVWDIVYKPPVVVDKIDVVEAVEVIDKVEVGDRSEVVDAVEVIDTAEILAAPEVEIIPENITDVKVEEAPKEVKAVKQVKKDMGVTPFVKSKYTEDDVVNLPVRRAKDILKSINDVKVLKKAIAMAKTRPGKESLIKLLRIRIKELDL